MMMDELDGKAKTVAPLYFAWAEDYLERYRAANDLHAGGDLSGAAAAGFGAI